VEILRVATVVITASNTKSGVKLTWTQSTISGVKYRIYRSAFVDGAWASRESVATLDDTYSKYTDISAKNGVLYRYSIRVIKGSTNSASDVYTEIVRLGLSAVSMRNEAAGIYVSWSANKAAEKYELYRSEYDDATSTWTAWGKPYQVLDAVEFMDTNVVNGVMYRYKVRVVSGDYTSSMKESIHRFLSRVNTQVSCGMTYITLKWDANPAAAKYSIYRKELVDGVWSGWKRIDYAAKGTTSYNDGKETVAGRIYQYRVTCVKDTYQSAARVTDEVMYLTGTTTTVAAKTGYVQITIKAHNQATSYTVQRRTVIDGVNGAWETIIMNTTELVVKDETAEAGVTYQYRTNTNNGRFTGTGKASSSVTAK
jgi:hypothetical protein